MSLHHSASSLDKKDPQDDQKQTNSIQQITMNKQNTIWTVILLLGISLLGWSLLDTESGKTDSTSKLTTNSTSFEADTDDGIGLIPIEQIKVGMRVAAKNPEVTEAERARFVDPDPKTWRFLRLDLVKEDGGILKIEMIRPKEWIEENRAQVGSIIYLEMPELGAVGDAIVKELGPCPRIAKCPGEVVISTFSHPATHAVLDVKFKDQDGETQTIGVTETHPFWSINAKAYVPSSELETGDELLTRSGQSRFVVSVLPRNDVAQKVINLEVHGEHVFFVGQNEILVHNNGYDKLAPRKADDYVTFYHGTSSANAASVRKGINKDFFDPQNDFGAGFYLFQNRNVDLTRARQMYGDAAEVLEYRILRSDLDNLRQLNFDGPTKAWQDFVRLTRQYEPPILSGGNPVDIISGPMFRKSPPNGFGPNGRTVANWPWPSEPQISIHTDRAIRLFNEGLVR